MAHTNLMCNAGTSQLAFIDIQARLQAAMSTDAMNEVVKNCNTLALAANLLEVPVLLTEQYPQGLGNTVPELSTLLPAIKPIEKNSFSCMAEPIF
nr:hydrolase [Methylotenera sp.]